MGNQNKESELRRFIFAGLIAFALGIPAVCQAQGCIDDLPTGEDWVRHLYRDLLPFWSMPEAVGNPEGNFPSFRYRDGSVVDPADSLREGLDEWEAEFPTLRQHLDNQYVRMMSRQTFLYGVGYHMTGDERFLALAKVGVDYLLENAQEKNGAFFGYFDQGDGQWHPEPGQRTPQDMAYALLGPAFYYYLTRDPEVLQAVVKGKEYIFRHYTAEDGRRLRWIDRDFVDAGGDTHLVHQVRLVGQLDQLNAYMVLLSPLLTDGRVQEEWKEDLRRLADLLVEEFYSEEHRLFWGDIGPEGKKFGEGGPDFGHTVKSFWMLYLISGILEDEKLEKFAMDGMAETLEEAYLPEVGAWGLAREEDGGIVRHRLWWTYAELDQAAATLGLRDPTCACKLAPTYRYWFEKFVDPLYGEVGTFIDDETGEIWWGKAFSWKNGFHSLEHCLIGYITGKAARGKPVDLYYAFLGKPEDDLIRPYYFRGVVEEVTVRDCARFPELKKYRVRFSGVR